MNVKGNDVRDKNIEYSCLLVASLKCLFAAAE